MYSDFLKKTGSAFLFVLASFILAIVNKQVLTSWHFPSFLVISIGQMASSIIVLFILKLFKIVSFSDFNLDLPGKLMPLPVMYFANMVTGLGSTAYLPLPMFTALRNFVILFTMLLEYIILSVKPSLSVQLSVWSIIAGTILAATDDLTFTITGYSYVMIANIMAATYGVYVKQKLDEKKIEKYCIMFYNSLFMILPTIAIAWFIGDLHSSYEFKHWLDPWFLIQFICSCFMGIIYSYFAFICTQFNSALTMSMLGCIKNIFVIYIGLFVGGDYIFSWLNFTGINISIIASIFYAYIIITKSDQKQEVEKETANTEQQA